MKKWMGMFLILVCVLGLTACGTHEEDILHHGVNAVITEIDAENEILTVDGLDAGEGNLLGENCCLDCAEASVIYCNYETQEVCDITFGDLVIGDEIILEISDSELAAVESGEGAVKVTQVQLGTQRLNQ